MPGVSLINGIYRYDVCLMYRIKGAATFGLLIHSMTNTQMIS